MLDISSTKKLNDGNSIPVLGLGTYQKEAKDEAEAAVLAALDGGYRHIDTAGNYGNEEAVGRALKKTKVARDEIFITTKIDEVNLKQPRKPLEASLKNLGLDYVDLYLIHWPMEERNELWHKLIDFQKQGLCKSIGVSNFSVKHLEQLKSVSSVVPAVNQVEFHPFLYQKELLDYCDNNGIVLEAYSPLTRGNKTHDTTIAQIAVAHGKTPAQVMIRWSLQHGLIAIPKSTNPKRIGENADVFDFELTNAEMQKLDGLNEDYRTGFDPSKVK